MGYGIWGFFVFKFQGAKLRVMGNGLRVCCLEIGVWDLEKKVLGSGGMSGFRV